MTPVTKRAQPNSPRPEYSSFVSTLPAFPDCVDFEPLREKRGEALRKPEMRRGVFEKMPTTEAWPLFARKSRSTYLLYSFIRSCPWIFEAWLMKHFVSKLDGVLLLKPGKKWIERHQVPQGSLSKACETRSKAARLCHFKRLSFESHKRV